MVKRRLSGKSNVTASLSSIVTYFEALPDPTLRRTREELEVGGRRMLR